MWDERYSLLQRQLRELRLEAGLTQAEVAALLKRPQSYVSKYESGERRLDIVEINDICKCLHTSLAVFVERLDRLWKGFDRDRS